MNKNKYDRAVTRVAQTKGQSSITDAEVIIALESEIEYYRHKIQLIESARESDKEAAKEDEESIKDLRKALIDSLNGIDITKTRTLNKIRKLFGYEEIRKQEDNNLKEIQTNDIYADGKIIKTIIEYKYNEEAE